MMNSEKSSEGATRTLLIFLLALTMVGAVLAILAGFGIAKIIPPGAPQAVACPTETIQSKPPPEVSLNINNSTAITGLAAKTSKLLKTAGFRVLSVVTKPSPLSVSSMELRIKEQKPQILIATPASQLDSAVTLQNYFPLSLVVIKPNEAPSIELYLLSDGIKTQSGVKEPAKLRCLPQDTRIKFSTAS